jgi:hypothetical protein
LERGFMVCTADQISSKLSYAKGWDGRGMLHVWGRREMGAGFGGEDLD